jgi:Fe(3+) dicitrate transport protein
VDRTFRFRTNVADAAIWGFESFAEVDLLRILEGANEDLGLSLYSNLALIRATYRNASENGVEGNAVELVPPLNFKTGLTFRWQEFRTSLQYAYVGEHFSDASNAIRTPTAIEGLIPAYYVMDWSCRYAWKMLQLEAGVNNLTNNLYFTRRATGYPGPGIIPSDGRSFYVSLQFLVHSP